MLSDSRRIGNRGPNRHDRLHSFPTGGAPLIEIDDIADRDQRPNQPEQIHVKFRELTNGDFAARCQWYAGPYDQHESESDQNGHQWSHQRINSHERQIFLGVFPIQFIECSYLCVLLGIRSHDAHPRKILLRAGGDLREEVLNFFEAYVDLLAEEFYGQRYERHGHEQKQRQLPINQEHERQDHDHHEDRLQAVHDHRSGKLAHGGQIVGGPRHQVAGSMFMKERERLIDQVSVKIIPQVVLDVPRHADKDATLKEQKKAAHGARAHDFRSGDRQFCPRHLSPSRRRRLTEC